MSQASVGLQVSTAETAGGIQVSPDQLHPHAPRAAHRRHRVRLFRVAGGVVLFVPRGGGREVQGVCSFAAWRESPGREGQVSGKTREPTVFAMSTADLPLKHWAICSESTQVCLLPNVVHVLNSHGAQSPFSWS